jgi:hypothetical protein
LEEVMDVIERRTTSLRKASRRWNIPLMLLSGHLWKTKNNMCTNSRRRLGNGFLGFGYAGCWVVNKPTTIENESGRIDPNKVSIFPRSSTKDILVVLV